MSLVGGRRRPVFRLLASSLVVSLTAGCGVAPLAPAGPSGPTPSARAVADAPAYAEDFKPPYRLAFELPRTTWRATDAIDGTATLSLVGPDSAEIGGSGSGFIGFSFVEVGGRHDVEPAWRSDCRGQRLDSGHPFVSEIVKSGGYTAD